MADYTFGHEVSGSLLSDVDADLRLGGLEDVNVDSTLNGRLDSAITAKSEATVEAALAGRLVSDSDVRTDSKVVSDSKVATDSRVASSVDLAPVAVDSCVRVVLGALPPTQVHTPWQQRLGLSVLGVELFAWVLSGETTTTLRPVPPVPQVTGSVEQRGDGDRWRDGGRRDGGPGRHEPPGRDGGPGRSHAPAARSGGLSIRLG